MAKQKQYKGFKPGQKYEVDEHGSLGLLALGHIGVEAWRKAKEEAKNKKKSK